MSASLNDRPNKVTVVDESVTVTAGAGVQGAQGDPGIVISGTEPDETDVLWADTSAAGSMVVPAGGTSGQVLAKASGDDYDSEWVTPASSGIPATLLDAKGDLIVASAADTAARLAVGTNGQVLAANSAQTTGAQWVTVNAMRLITSTTLGAGQNVITFDSIPSTYTHLAIRARARIGNGGTGFGGCNISFNGDLTAANYQFENRVTFQSSTAAGFSANSFILARFGESGQTNVWGNAEILIPFYTAASWKRVIATNSFTYTSGVTTDALQEVNGQWKSTTTISSITITTSTSTFDSGSIFELWGMS